MILTQLFCDIDDFCKEFEKELEKRLINETNQNNKKGRKSRLTKSEIITIIVYFHMAKFRTFKDYYISYVQKQLKDAFKDLVSYNRFVELMPKVLLLLTAFMIRKRRGKVTGVSFIDSTIIRVCHIKREKQHKVFKGLAKKAKSSMGWYYGFKLHLVVNDKGEILSFLFTPANVNDNNKEIVKKLTKEIFGKLIGDKGYISKELFKELYKESIELITKVRKNMKNKLLPLIDKLLLRKRALIESINDELKNIAMLEHTRHRSPTNAFVNWISVLVAYTYFPKKPSIKIYEEDRELLEGMAF